MKNTAIIIPSRLGAERFPNKPLEKINNLPMIVHTIKRAQESQIGEVFVATPDDKIFDIVKENGGQPIMTKHDHLSGSDRIYEAYSNNLGDNIDLIINLQGDMPNIKPSSSSKLEKLMREKKCEIGTLASVLRSKNEINDPNIVKVQVDEDLNDSSFIYAKDFFRIKKDLRNEKIYHHIGIYAFTNVALTKYVKLSRSKLEIERKLEQMRAIENNIKIMVGFSDSSPLSVDTKEDLKKVIEEMN
jgi:3-deoxy-manno-octulosonate cytidylyltransferase (CMP-KDO synthetase)